MRIFSGTQGQVTHKSLIGSCLISSPSRDFMGVLNACKNEEDSIKNKGARVVTILFIDFSDAQWQLTPKSVMGSCPN